MGYYVDINGHFDIEVSKEAAALTKIKHDLEEQGNWGWVDPKEMDNATTLEEALVAGRWENCSVHPHETQKGVNSYVISMSSKSSDENRVLEAIAPFVIPTPDLEWAFYGSGEDGEAWAGRFDNGLYEEVGGTVIYGPVKIEPSLSRDTLLCILRLLQNDQLDPNDTLSVTEKERLVSFLEYGLRDSEPLNDDEAAWAAWERQIKGDLTALRDNLKGA